MFREAIKYFNCPSYNESNKPVAARAFIIFMFKFILLIILVGIINGLIYAFETIPPNTLGNFHVSSFQAFLIPALFFPVIEEFVFRLNLRISLNNLLVLFTFIFGIFLYRMLRLNQTENLFFIGILPFIFIMVLVYFKYYGSQKMEEYIRNFWRRHFVLIFHASCWIFAFLHLCNFEEITPTLLFLSPVIVLPQLMFGYALGFLRMNYGFQYNVIFHVVYNSIFSLSFIQ